MKSSEDLDEDLDTQTRIEDLDTQTRIARVSSDISP
jgi:hypothetical protein